MTALTHKVPKRITWNFTDRGHYMTPSSGVDIVETAGRYYASGVDIVETAGRYYAVQHHTVKRIIGSDVRVPRLIPVVEYIKDLINNTSRVCRVWIEYSNSTIVCVYYYQMKTITMPEGIT